MTHAWEDALAEDEARREGFDLGWYALPYFPTGDDDDAFGSFLSV
jgi:hypothetical protein